MRGAITLQRSSTPVRGPGSRYVRACVRDSGALLPAAVQMRRTDLTSAQKLEAFGEDLLQLGLRTTLQEHVPVRADGLLVLHHWLATVDSTTELTRLRVLPLVRNLGLIGHGDRERVPIGTDVLDLLAGSHLDAALVLEALRSESCAA